MGWGPFNSHSILLCLRRGVLTFRFRGCNPHFQNIENVLYPVGVCNADTVGGPIVFTYVLFCVPRRDSAKQIPKEIQLFLLMSYFVLGYIGLSIHTRFFAFWDLENVLMCGLDGRTGGTVHQKCPLIFIILCTYIDKVYTYLKRKKNTKHPYGFESLMSSWGPWWKISNLQKVGDVKVFSSKSSLFFSRVRFGFLGGKKALSRYIPYLYMYKVWWKLMDTFDIPSVHPTRYPHNSAFRLVV